MITNENQFALSELLDDLTSVIKQREQSRPKVREKAWVRDLLLKQKLTNGQKAVIHVNVHYRYQRTKLSITASKVDSFSDNSILSSLNTKNSISLDYDFTQRYDIPSLDSISLQINNYFKKS